MFPGEEDYQGSQASAATSALAEPSGAAAPPTAGGQPADSPATAPVAAAPASAAGAAAPQSQAATQALAQPQHPAEHDGNVGKKILNGILGALGGTTEVQYRVDPQSGKMIATHVKSGPGQQWKRIIAGGLAGAAAGAQQHGPGAKGKAAGAGFGAGFDMFEKADEKKYGRARDEFDMQQKAAVSKAQIALTTQQLSESAYRLSRMQVEGAFNDSDRENQFVRSIQEGGANSRELGVFATPDELYRHVNQNPTLAKAQADGLIIGSPHIVNGRYAGMRYALVTPDWLKSKLASDRTLSRLVPPKEAGKEPTVETQTIQAGSMTNGEYEKARQTYDTEINSHYEKAADRRSEEKRTNTAAGATVQAAREHAGATRYAADKGVEKAQITANRRDIRDHDKAYVQPAEQTEQTWKLADKVYQEYQQAKKEGRDLPTGAQSMVMFSSHIATTMGLRKGMGNRINKDEVKQHMGARPVSDSALVAVQKLVDGDQLSPEQWEAFHTLVKESRDIRWDTAAKEAARKSIPVDFLPDDLAGLKPNEGAAASGGVTAPAGATEEVIKDGKVIGHVVDNKFVPVEQPK